MKIQISTYMFLLDLSLLQLFQTFFEQCIFLLRLYDAVKNCTITCSSQCWKHRCISLIQIQQVWKVIVLNDLEDYGVFAKLIIACKVCVECKFEANSIHQYALWKSLKKPFSLTLRLLYISFFSFQYTLLITDICSEAATRDVL